MKNLWTEFPLERKPFSRSAEQNHGFHVAPLDKLWRAWSCATLKTTWAICRCNKPGAGALLRAKANRLGVCKHLYLSRPQWPETNPPLSTSLFVSAGRSAPLLIESAVKYRWTQEAGRLFLPFPPCILHLIPLYPFISLSASPLEVRLASLCLLLSLLLLCVCFSTLHCCTNSRHTNPVFYLWTVSRSTRVGIKQAHTQLISSKKCE